MKRFRLSEKSNPSHLWGMPELTDVEEDDDCSWAMPQSTDVCDVKEAPPKRFRLRHKTKPLQTPVLAAPLDVEADVRKRRQVYLVTFPHPVETHSKTGRQLVSPGSLTKKQVLQMLMACFENPSYRNPKDILAGRPIPLSRAGLWREFHQEDENGVAFAHDHTAVLASRGFMFSPVKRALLERYGLASHWSSSHDGYWSPVRYLAIPSLKKPAKSLDPYPDLWVAEGAHPPVAECCNPPLTANAIKARREYAETKAAAEGKKQPRVSELDIWPVVISNGIRNTPDDPTAAMQLIAWLKTKGTLEMQQYCSRIVLS